ncbi:MAG: response regulator [Methanoregula sp.]|nr:response regulator [Methanoregula sp.]
MISALYVDDDTDLLELAQVYLKNATDLKIHISSSASDALILINEQHFDVIVSDYQMPEMNGIEFLKTVRTKYEHLPFILFTGRGREEVVMQAIENGVDSYIQKGGDARPQFTELTHKIRQIVKLKQMEESLDESEKRFRSIAERSSDLILTMDEKFQITYASPSIKTILGYLPEECTGKDLSSLGLSPDILSEIHHLIENFTTDTSDFERNTRFKKRDGCYTVIAMRGTPRIRNKTIDGIQIHGRVIAGGSPAQDELELAHARISAVEEQIRQQLSSISQSEQALTELRIAEKALKQANNKLNLMNSITRHDILNKITVARGYLDIILMMETDPLLLSYLKKEDRAVAAIEEQIAFTKIYQDLGVNGAVWQRVDLTIYSSLSRIDLGHVALQCDLPCVEIYADPLLEKVFYNLADNALAYGETITKIHVHATEDADGLVLIWEDDGIGILPEAKEKIFLRGVGKNTGLGLFLVREILSITGITIIETGEYGSGARLEIKVPHGVYRFMDTAPVLDKLHPGSS